MGRVFLVVKADDSTWKGVTVAPPCIPFALEGIPFASKSGAYFGEIKGFKSSQ